MKTWQAILFGLFVGLLSSGFILLVASQPRGKPIEIIPPPTPGPLLIHVTGAVINPGLYELPRNSRAGDAVKMAGGFSAEADTEFANLAAPLQDGQQVIIPNKGDISVQVSSRNPVSAQNQQVININAASADELQELPGIGPTRAQDIIEYRDQHGAFQSIDDLLNVPGIGPTTLENLKELITTGP